MKKINYLILVFVILSACNPMQLDEIVDPNNPSVSSVSSNATRNQLQFLITGLESRHRGFVTVLTQSFNTFGREIWYLNSSDPRFQTDWLGQAGRVPDANYFGFGTTGGAGYAFPYQAIKQALVLMEAAENTNSISPAERSAIRGFAKTIMGFQYMIPANFVYDNGIRVDIKDPLKPGPYVSYQEALAYAEGLLNEGMADLTAAGSAGTAFPFVLTSGWTGFNTNGGIQQVNRAIAARLNAYQKDWQGVLDALNGSFMNLSGNLNAGPTFVYTGPPDIFNPLFFLPNAATTTIIVVHPSLLAAATPGDKRVTDKFFLRTTPVTVTTDVGPLVGTHQDKRWASNTSPISWIRNEELILLKAEAHAQLSQTTNAVAAIDVIRTAALIGSYSGATDQANLINEILYQRRYSLWCEPWGHRWIDARRYDRLNQIPTSFDGGTIFTQFPRPQADLNWDLFAAGL